MKIKPQKASTPRVYQGAGVCVPSVTEVLKVLEKRHLETWRARVGRQEADRVSQAATSLGTQVHSVAQQVAQQVTWGRDYKFTWTMEPFAGAIRDFLNAHVKEVIITELSLVSQKERVGGTLDLYCRLHDDTLAVVDYKTSAQLTREHGLQLALYALLLRENGYPVNKRICVRIRKDKPGAFYARSYANHLEDVRAARACVELWHWLHSKKLTKALEAVEEDVT